VLKHSCKSSQETQLTLNVWVKITIKNYQFMLNEILNLEGVAVLSKEQQKSVNGGYRNCVATGRSMVLESPDDTITFTSKPVAETCEFKCETTLLGFHWGYTTRWGGCGDSGNFNFE
jgi:hypothetical protein